jgi:hypothetical protein
MHKLRFVGLPFFLLAFTLNSRLSGQEQHPSWQNFGLTNVWKVNLTLSPEEYDAMQPALPGPPGSAPPPASTNARPSERNLFGTAFPWAEGGAEINGRAFEKVALRYAGDFTYFVTARNLKRPLTIRITDRDGQGAASEH